MEGLQSQGPQVGTFRLGKTSWIGDMRLDKGRKKSESSRHSNATKIGSIASHVCEPESSVFLSRL